MGKLWVGVMCFLGHVSVVIILLLLSIPSLAHSQISNMPEGKAPNLIVYVHGCCTDEKVDKDVTNLRNRLWEAYKGQTFVQSGEWEIVVWDWSDYTPKRGYPPNDVLQDPREAYENVLNYPDHLYRNLANVISSHIYQHVHLIGHSAGANFIQWTAQELVSIYTTRNEAPFIHLTFLDAFTMSASDVDTYGFLSNYPNHYSEHYVHRGLAFGDISTDEFLSNAFNFDITDWLHALSEDGFGGHSWPVNWYIKSIAAPEPEFTYLRYGYPLSRESGNHQFINVMGQLYPPPSSDPSDPNRGIITLHTESREILGVMPRSASLQESREILGEINKIK